MTTRWGALRGLDDRLFSPGTMNRKQRLETGLVIYWMLRRPPSGGRYGVEVRVRPYELANRRAIAHRLWQARRDLAADLDRLARQLEPHRAQRD